MNKTKIKTLLLTPRLSEPGGVANYYSVLQNHLPDDVEYFYIGNDSDGTIVGKVLRLLLDYARFVRILIFNRPKIIHLNPSLGFKSTPRDAFFSLLGRFFLIKTVVFFRGWELPVQNKINNNAFLLKLFSWSFFGSKKIIVLASDFDKVLRSWGYTGDIVIETTIVDDSFVDYELPPLEQRFTKLLFLSRIERKKGIFEVIDAFKSLKKSNPDLELSIAGDGPDMSSVVDYIDDNNIKGISLLGYVKGNEKINVFLNHGVYLFPTSYGEGMPNALLEAMAFAMPVITSPAGGIADLFEDKKMGCLIKNPDSDSVKKAISEVLSDKNNQMVIGKYNRNYIKNRCVASKVAKRLINVYDSLIKDTN